VFDPSAETWTTYTAAPFTSSTDWTAGAVLPAGRVLMLPGTASVPAVTFDYRTDVLATLAAPPQIANDARILPDGRVIVAVTMSDAADRSFVFHWRTDDYVNLAPSPTTYEQTVAAMLPNGRVVMAGPSVDYSYDYADDRWVTTSAAPAGTIAAHQLLPDGRMLYAVDGADSQTYDYTSESLTTLGALSTVASSYQASSTTVLPDGRVYLGGGSAGVPTLFDYESESLTTFDFPDGGRTVGGTLLPDGAIVTVPLEASSQVAVLRVSNPRNTSLALCYHPAFNKAR